MLRCAGGRSGRDSFGRGVGRVNVPFGSGTGNRRFQRLKHVDDETGRLPSCLCSEQLRTLAEICSEPLGLQIRLKQRRAILLLFRVACTHKCQHEGPVLRPRPSEI